MVRCKLNLGVLLWVLSSAVALYAVDSDGYYIYKGYSDKEFETAAFALDMWHVSEPVHTSVGYSIMMRAEKEDSYIENEKHFSEMTGDLSRPPNAVMVFSEML